MFFDRTYFFIAFNRNLPCNKYRRYDIAQLLFWMKLAIGSDHAGYRLKMALLPYLKEQGYEVSDYGTGSEERADYPDFGHAVASAVEAGQAELGIAICGSGNGICITANRHAGIRAVLAWLPEVAALGRQHNDANVLCLPARYLTEEEGIHITQSFLAARFEGGRHLQRVQKI